MSLRPAPDLWAESQPVHRRRWGWWVAAVALVVAGSVIGVLHSSWLSVHDIEIRGAEHADVARRLEEAGVGEGAIMLWVSPGEVEAAVLGDPWVREARVQRVLPDTLVIEVLEHTPLVWIEGTTTWMLVARDGSVLEHAESPEPGLLQAGLSLRDAGRGEIPGDPVWWEVVEMALAVEASAAADMRLDGGSGTVWGTFGGIRFDLGPPIELADKGRVMAAMVGEEIPEGWSVDLVAPRRPALVPPSLREQSELKVEPPMSGPEVEDETSTDS